MKKKLLLYLSPLDFPGNVSIASTLAWLCKTRGVLFDTYYDSYHQGLHFVGGDSRDLETGQLTGGTVCGDRHFQEFYFLLHNFDVSVILTGETIFSKSIRNLGIPVVSLSDKVSVLYRDVFRDFKVPLPADIVLTGSDDGTELPGLNAYLYPEIYYRRALGVEDSISMTELAALYPKGGKVSCLYVRDDVVTRLHQKGYDVDIIDRLEPNDDYCSISERIVRRWKDRAKGWILGDPTLVAHWIPTACEDDLIAVYSVPQERIVTRLGDLISTKGNVIYGRQYSDRDFFALSRLNQCLQIIDPCRPPFQSVKHVEYVWENGVQKKGLCKEEYSDEELRQFAGERRILISPIFWSGMIREVENMHNLVDLIAMTGLRCGLVLTAQSFDYMMHAPLELLTIPWEQGGVYPLVEPLLGSCGIGVGIESCMSSDRLKDNMMEGLTRIKKKVTKNNLPQGWWATMDTDLRERTGKARPKPARLQPFAPYLQFRFHLHDGLPHREDNPKGKNILRRIKQKSLDRLKRFVKESGLEKYFEPYRPYEFYDAGPIRKNIIEAVKAVGLQYMFTKAGFHSSPEIQYKDDDFIALNYTAGQWDGWTPFETVNDISDLEKAEKILRRQKKPGWIVSTIDSCLWTFSGEFWKRGSRLYDIARFCADGGRSGELINAKPITIARYARILSENGG